MYGHSPVGGGYHYKHLLMGVDIYPYSFQHNMNYLFHEFEYIHSYIDQILISKKGDWTDHVQKL